jgi:hypothetical protein
MPSDPAARLLQQRGGDRRGRDVHQDRHPPRTQGAALLEMGLTPTHLHIAALVSAALAICCSLIATEVHSEAAGFQIGAWAGLLLAGLVEVPSLSDREWDDSSAAIREEVDVGSRAPAPDEMLYSNRVFETLVSMAGATRACSESSRCTHLDRRSPAPRSARWPARSSTTTTTRHLGDRSAQ